ncbi:beta-glucanase (GH16 family) [Saccharothrix ecbatanensis]|uniref:Beta-glucanase (GH16 family) n=1 Tax=Saccharothrix ecbatanensis TaxID=1105145 RepID=A0A7W9HH01_9PSEU|nr:beta-glucanase (GH16 family) [Saccharothrix ecbatanensis]
MTRLLPPAASTVEYAVIGRGTPHPRADTQEAPEATDQGTPFTERPL